MCTSTRRRLAGDKCRDWRRGGKEQRPVWCSRNYGGRNGPSELAIFTRKRLARCARPFSSSHHFCTWQIHFLLNRRNHLKIEREHSHRFGYYQRNDKEMFSLVPQEGMAQPPTVHRQRTRKSSTRSATSSSGSFGKVMVRAMVSRVYSL